MGQKSLSIGTIYGELESLKLQKWNNYNFEYYNECTNCKILPICMGGCPYTNLKTNRKNCNSIKYNVNSMLELLRDCTQQK